jgi:hypothetical protein
MRQDEENFEKAGEQEQIRDDKDEPMLYCPMCSLRLTELKCKLICAQCGYYMSCADYY